MRTPEQNKQNQQACSKCGRVVGCNYTGREHKCNCGKTKRLLTLLVIVGILISASGCMSTEWMTDTLNKPVNEMTVIEWMILK